MKYKLHRSPSTARIVILRKVHVRHVSRKEETRTAHRIVMEITLVKCPLIV